MLALSVKVRVKPEERERFLKAIEVDAVGSEKDEPGCLRFNVLQDQRVQDVYYFFEVYPERGCVGGASGRTTLRRLRAATNTLDGPPEATHCDTLFPAAAGYWDKRGSLS